jgi:hypothetical protein
MKHTSVILGVFLCLLSGSILAAQGADVTGKWNLTLVSPRGERTRVIECIQKGEDLTVIMTGRGGEKREAKGTVKGSDIEWSLTRETSSGTFTSTYTGKIEGDEIKGTVKYGTRGTGEWSAKRVP